MESKLFIKIGYAVKNHLEGNSDSPVVVFLLKTIWGFILMAILSA